MAITKRLAAENPDGKLFRNTNGKDWTPEAVNCAFQAIRHRRGKDEMKRRGLEISKAEIEAKIKTLSPTRTSRGKVIKKTPSEFRMEAKRR